MLDQGAHDISFRRENWAARRRPTEGYGGIGTYSAMFGTSPDKGKYMLSLKKGKDGKWMIHEDIFNSDMPCAPAPAK